MKAFMGEDWSKQYDSTHILDMDNYDTTNFEGIKIYSI